ncbi:glycosyltransferase family 4 protein [bacterium]|nr:glycosyltransferase family 4 protein [bacterium]QQR57629.1 MAG: glycosyltransferase family 4 protein [Candidatus Melainabacteria bacterium]
MPVSPLLIGKHIAMVVRQFSPHGGLELYTHKLVEGLLLSNLKVTVICEENKSEFKHHNLQILTYGEMERPGTDGLARDERFRYAFRNSKILLQRHKGEFDLIHSQHLPCPEPDVVTFHNHSVRRLSSVGETWEKLLNESKIALAKRYKARNTFDKYLMDNALCRVFVSQVMKEDYYQVFGADEKDPYVIAYPGASTNTDYSTITPVEESEFTFVFSGRGFRKKGLDILFRACQILKKQGQKFKLLVTGVRDRLELKIRAKWLGIEDQVEFLGFVTDIERIYARAKVLVLPSRVEPFGMVPVQAMQLGLVPIVSRACGVSEVLKHNEDSLILEDHLDPSELASLMRTLMFDDQMRINLSNNARLAVKNINWQHTLEATLEAYEKALSTPRKTPVAAVALADYARGFDEQES